MDQLSTVALIAAQSSSFEEFRTKLLKEAARAHEIAHFESQLDRDANLKPRPVDTSRYRELLQALQEGGQQ